MKILLSLLTLALVGSALAQDATLNSGDTAWMLASSALVMLMTPGLAFFYGGLVRGKAVLNTMMMSFIALAIISISWVLIGYTLAFGEGGSALLGSLKFLGLSGMNGQLSGTIPTYAFMAFQAMFAIITPALMSGAVVDRMKFGAFALFVTLWGLVVYAPLAHWVWSPDGWLDKLGALDFAGGTVVHMSAGFSALVAAWLLGPRLGVNRRAAAPHNVPFVLLGAALLWFGWFGFNAGSALAANQSAALAFVTTNTAAAAALLTWLLWESLRGQKPSAVGAATGAVVGLVAITPAAGFVSPLAALAIGAIGASVSFWVVQLKERARYDDALDVFACHGMGGMTGAILTGVFAFTTASGKATLTQIGIQLVGVAATIALAVIGTFVLIKIVSAMMGLRVSAQAETEGIDISSHQQAGYAAGELGLDAPVIVSVSD